MKQRTRFCQFDYESTGSKNTKLTNKSACVWILAGEEAYVFANFVMWICDEKTNQLVCGSDKIFCWVLQNSNKKG